MTADPEVVLTLVDAFVPQLTAGKYVLTATQTLHVETDPNKFEDVRTSALKTFYVSAPRFNLAPDEIYSRYPADGHRGAYHRTLPHVVCRRKALPWERPLVPGGSPPVDAKSAPEPWMALLLFDADELPEGAFHTCSFQQMVEPPAGVRGPDIELAPWEKDDAAADPANQQAKRCTALDIPTGLFRKVAPHRAELPYLTHARLVATHDKEDILGVGDGWFSVVFANRLPAEKKRNVAVLVSLEGHGELIGDTECDTTQADKIRLAVLQKWEFVSEGPTFEERVANLHRGKDPWLRVPPDAATAGSAPVRTALDLGYVPMQHRLRHGDRTVSWYRGPLVPVAAPAATGIAIFANADEALQYDPDTGLFDASYAAAWQLGRLLALQSPEFARTLFHSESGYVAAAIVDRADALSAQSDPAASGPERSARLSNRLQRAARLQQDDLMVALACEWCT